MVEPAGAMGRVLRGLADDQVARLGEICDGFRNRAAMEGLASCWSRCGSWACGRRRWTRYTDLRTCLGICRFRIWRGRWRGGLWRRYWTGWAAGFGGVGDGGGMVIVGLMKVRLWTRDEVIVAMGLYFTMPFGKMHKGYPRSIVVAGSLGRTPSSLR